MGCIQHLSDNYGDILGLIVTIAIFIIGLTIERKTKRIQVLAIRKDFIRPIIEFSNEAIDVISQLEALCHMNPEIKEVNQVFWDRRNELLSQVSSLRDKGKLLLPNESPRSYGQNRSSAYRGIRQKSLDALKAAFYAGASINFVVQGFNLVPAELTGEIEDIQAKRIKKSLDELPRGIALGGPTIARRKEKGWSSKQAIVEAKRQFVSEVFDIIEPETWIENINSFPLKKQSKGA